MKKFLIILSLIISPVANAGSACREYFKENNKVFKYKENMDQVNIEYSFKPNGEFNMTEKKLGLINILVLLTGKNATRHIGIRNGEGGNIIVMANYFLITILNWNGALIILFGTI